MRRIWWGFITAFSVILIFSLVGISVRCTKFWMDDMDSLLESILVNTAEADGCLQQNVITTADITKIASALHTACSDLKRLDAHYKKFYPKQHFQTHRKGDAVIYLYDCMYQYVSNELTAVDLESEHSDQKKLNILQNIISMSHEILDQLLDETGVFPVKWTGNFYDNMENAITNWYEDTYGVRLFLNGHTSIFDYAS